MHICVYMMHYNLKGCTISLHCASSGCIIFFRGETRNTSKYEVSMSISRSSAAQWQSYFPCSVLEMYLRHAFAFMHALIWIVLQCIEDMSSKSCQSTLFQWIPGSSEAKTSKIKAQTSKTKHRHRKSKHRHRKSKHRHKKTKHRHKKTKHRQKETKHRQK